MFGPCLDASWKTSVVLNTRSYLGMSGLHTKGMERQAVQVVPLVFLTTHYNSREEMTDPGKCGIISLMR